MWPWQRHRREVEEVNRRAAAAEVHVQIADNRLKAAKRQAQQSRSVTDALRREIEKNGWTEMLQHAWGGR